MPYWQLFYHIVWATRNREPLLTESVAPIIHGFLRSKAIGLGATVFALNGTADHVHLVGSIPPRIAVATFVGQVKGVASTKFNKSGISDASFFWQEDYGVFSFDGKRLPNFIAYVERQKEHHAQNTTLRLLERTDNDDVLRVHEANVPYLVEDEAWKEELEQIE